MKSTRYAKSDNLSIAYRVAADGPGDLVVVPGIVSHVEAFHELPGYSRFIERLASFARVITLDKRGTRLSDRIVDAPTYEQRMADVWAVMDAAGIERAALFGVSEGGPLDALSPRHSPDGRRCSSPSVRSPACLGLHPCRSPHRRMGADRPWSGGER